MRFLSWSVLWRALVLASAALALAALAIMLVTLQFNGCPNWGQPEFWVNAVWVAATLIVGWIVVDHLMVGSRGVRYAAIFLPVIALVCVIGYSIAASAWGWWGHEKWYHSLSGIGLDVVLAGLVAVLMVAVWLGCRYARRIAIDAANEAVTPSGAAAPAATPAEVRDAVRHALNG